MSFDPMTGEPIEEVKEPEMKFDPMTGEPIQQVKEPEAKFDPMTGEPIQQVKEPEAKFDPMTGEPIQQVKEPEAKFDPMTGEPIQQVKEPEAKFDPMTGEPIQQVKEPEMNFDPMTGEPIQQVKEPEMKFDPMTGEPIQQVKEPEMNFDPMTGQPIQNVQTQKKSKIKVMLIAAAGVAVVGVVAFAGIVSGAFLGKGNKVLLAVSNTFTEENHLAEDLSVASDIVSSGKYTMDVKGEVKGVGMEVTYIQDSADKQMKGNIDVGYVDVDFDTVLDKKQLSVTLPTISDKVFTYAYAEKKDGYLAEEFEDEVQAIDRLLATAYSSKEQDELLEELVLAVMKEYKELEFEKADKKELEVNGKRHNCKGYEVTITSDNLVNVLDNIEDVLEEYEESLEKTDFDKIMSQIRSGLRELPDMDLAFYIYKNKLAYVRMEAQREETEWFFLGGDTRMQNMRIEQNGTELLEIKGDTGSGEERSRVYVAGIKVCEVNYHYKNGELKIEAPQMFVRVNVDSKRDGIAISLDEFEVSGISNRWDGEISIRKGGKVEQPKGDVFDLGNASESDFEDFGEEIAAFGIGGLSF